MDDSDDRSEERERELRADLVALCAELESILASSREGAKPVELDLPIGRISRVDALQQQSMLIANREGARMRLRQVAAALVRLDTGEYGDCAVCGEPIGYPRLKARPEAPLCLACQSRRETRE